MHFRSLIVLCIIAALIATYDRKSSAQATMTKRQFAEKYLQARSCQYGCGYNCQTAPKLNYEETKYRCETWGNSKCVCGREGEWACCKCGSCFPAAARVTLKNGTSVAMAELKIGDKVKTGNNGRYNEVMSFMTNSHVVTTSYKCILSSCNKTIRLTGNHLIYSRKEQTDKFNQIYADDVNIGDEVLVDESDELIPTKIAKISSLTMQGAFVPLTKEGNILVDGVLASCYASFDHDLAHIMMTPMQWFPEIIVTKLLGRWILPFQSMYIY